MADKLGWLSLLHVCCPIMSLCFKLGAGDLKGDEGVVDSIGSANVFYRSQKWGVDVICYCLFL